MLPTIGAAVMTERTQIGPAVDAKLWERFRQDVKARKGTIRGNLGNELDRALREYLKDGGNPTERKIEERLARIEEAAGLSPADGGTLSLADETHTRAEPEPTPTPNEKPSPNAATDKKVRWLAEQLIQQEVPKTREIEQVPRDTVRDLVIDTYGFRSDTAKRYVEMLVDEFGLVSHPHTDKVLVTLEKREEIIRDDMENDND